MEIIEKQVEKVKEVPTDGCTYTKIQVRDNLTLSFCLYYKYFIYIDKSNLFTIL